MRFEVRTTIGRPRRGDRPELGDRDREVRQELEQERLELVVGAVDLVDQQHDRRSSRLERLEQRPAQQEPPREQLALVDAALGRAQREQLARVVPVVDRVVEVDALVALQADQARAGRGRQRPRHLGLADAGLALEQQRLLEHDRQVDRQRERPVGQVVLGGERGARRLDGLDLQVQRRLTTGPLPPSARACTGPAPGAACSRRWRSDRPGDRCPRRRARRPRRSLSAFSGCPRSASSTAVARSGTEPMLVSPTRTSSQMSPVALTTALTATIAQSSLRRLNFW